MEITSPRVVTVSLAGGLGNQMFQYAAGRAVAERDGRDLFLDDRILSVDVPGATRREYALGIFEIDAPLVSRLDRSAIHGAPPPVLIAERNQRVGPEIFAPNASPHIYLYGVWHSEKYFRSIAGRLRADFRLRSFAGDNSWSKAIASSEMPVCLHVRRGDYLSQAGKHMGFLGEDYYRRAVDRIAKQVARPEFFIFSDDIAWCEEHLRLDYPQSFVRHAAPAEACTALDLELMMQCRHFIIANSSYSWWAAWLAPSPEKIVVAPARWFSDERWDATDFVPDEWLKL
jgi:hypothetical protein